MFRSICIMIFYVTFAVFGFAAHAVPEDTDTVNNVVIILDASGSMSENMGPTQVSKMDAAKDALVQVMKTIPSDTHVGLLVFSARNLSNDWVYPLGPLDFDQLEKAIRLPLPGGQTPLGAYIKKGADRLLEERTRRFGYGTYRLLIVTDGEAQDGRLVDAYTPEVLARGITMDVIGVSMPVAHTLATKVNSYRKADDPATLSQAVKESFAEVDGDDKDIADNNAFKELDSIPDDLARGLIRAVSATENDNEPISGRLSSKKQSLPSNTGTAKASGKLSTGGSVFNVFLLVIGVFVIIRLITRKKGTAEKKTRRRKK